MRCKACDAELSDFEATRKSINTWDYIELCNACFSGISGTVPTISRHDLMSLSDVNALDYVDPLLDNLDDELA